MVARPLQAKVREIVSVTDAAAAGVSAAIDTAAIQAVCTSLSANGGNVYFPDIGTDFLLNNNVNVPAGVNLVGPGSVRRTHALAVSNYAFTLNGDNKVSGLNYDGGGLTIVSPGSPLSIKDFRCIGDDITFDRNTLNNSCGSFIDFSNDQYALADTLNGLVAFGNNFGDYFDHAIYCQGYNLVPTGNIIVTGNSFIGTAATTTRQALKFKNVDYASASGNTFNLPNGIFCTVEVGLDAPLECRDCTEISLIGNTGKAFRFLESIADLAALNRGYKIKGLTVSANTAICTGAVVSLGLTPQDSTVTFATRCEKVAITGNTFEGIRFTINGDINGVNNGIEDVIISNNAIKITAGNTIFQTYGNIYTLIAKDNTLNLTTAYNSGNAVINRNSMADSFAWSIPTITGYFEISGNTLLGGFGALLAEQPAGAVTTINFVAVIDSNRMINANTYRTVALTSSAIGTATGRVYAQNNKFFGGTLAGPACANFALYTETDDSKRYVDPASTAAKQGGRSAVYVCSADLGFDPLTLGAGVFYHAYKKADGTYVRVA